MAVVCLELDFDFVQSICQSEVKNDGPGQLVSKSLRFANIWAPHGATFLFSFDVWDLRLVNKIPLPAVRLWPLLHSRLLRCFPDQFFFFHFLFFPPLSHESISDFIFYILYRACSFSFPFHLPWVWYLTPLISLHFYPLSVLNAARLSSPCSALSSPAVCAAFLWTASLTMLSSDAPCYVVIIHRWRVKTSTCTISRFYQCNI